jgi:diaminopimelate decarboxylase
VECRIVFECGRFIAADCGYYVTEVVDLKRNHGKYFAILRGGTHHFRLPASWQHNHPFSILPNETWPYAFERPSIGGAAVTLCGELCTPKDVLARDVEVEQLRVGDRIVFKLAGAYGWHISHHDFLSHPHPERKFIETPRNADIRSEVPA